MNDLKDIVQMNINEVSYIGNPKSHTACFLAKKLEKHLANLYRVSDCIVFIEDTIDIPSELSGLHRFVVSSHPQAEYARFIYKVSEKKRIEDFQRKLEFKSGYWIGENVKIGANAYIENGVTIGHDVVIGNNVVICSGATIKNAIIGDNCIFREGVVLGGEGFTMARDENNRWIRIPSLGKVEIGNDVELGMNDVIARGTAGSTLIDDYVKLDALVYVGHDAHIHNNTEISSGAIIGGYVDVGDDCAIGFNSGIRNRIEIGDNAVVGMGAAVVKSVDDGELVVGVPAKKMEL